MSKVAITGNASGTGTFTLAAPNSNSDRTLTLPDVTGTIVTTGSSPSFPTTIGVGGATPSTSGAGITFPATQSASSDANTLDDYEEGTWTPTLTPATSGTITLGSPNLCAYTKIGRVVHINGLVDVSSVSSPVGATVTINNLPFTSNGTGTQRSTGAARGAALTSGGLNTTMVVLSNVTTILLFIDASVFQTGSQVTFQVSYTV